MHPVRRALLILALLAAFPALGWAQLPENFDGVTAPALPAGWTTSFTNGAANCTPTGTCALGSNFTTVSTTSDTAPNSAFHNDPSCVTDSFLTSPSIAVPAGTSQLTFRNSFNMESTFDGGVLELSINGGAFSDIVTAGGSFVVGGYTGSISPNFLSPIAGRQAWTGNSGGFITTTATLPAAAAGQNVVFRFRAASDCSVSATGWNVDTISLSGGSSCVLTCPANDTFANDPNQCGRLINYPAPTTSGTCNTVTCSPASGSFFPVGTTTITCTATAGPSCSFTETVNDTQPPALTQCPADIQLPSPPGGATTLVVNYTAPSASDNCPGVTAACVPPSGSAFPVGATTPVLCTATDNSTNTSSCGFNVAIAAPSLLEIPTLSQIGLVVLALLLAGAAFVALRRGA